MPQGEKQRAKAVHTDVVDRGDRGLAVRARGARERRCRCVKPGSTRPPPAPPTAPSKVASRGCGTASTWPAPRRPARATLTSSRSPRAAELVSRGGLGLLWFNARTYDNFVLRLQFKTADDTDNSGVFVRFPNPGTDPNVAINQGHEIQIREGVAGDGEDQKTGSIYNSDREDARGRQARRPVERLRDPLPGRHVHDHAQRHGREHVDQHVHAGHGGRLHRPPEPRRQRRGLVPQRPHPGACGAGQHPHDDRHHAHRDARQRPDPGRLLFKGEEMPPSGTVGTAPERRRGRRAAADADTTGTKANLAEFRGQTLTLDPADQKNFSRCTSSARRPTARAAATSR